MSNEIATLILVVCLIIAVARRIYAWNKSNKYRVMVSAENGEIYVQYNHLFRSWEDKGSTRFNGNFDRATFETIEKAKEFIALEKQKQPDKVVYEE